MNHVPRWALGCGLTLAACGGKVIFDTSATGTGGGTTSGASTTHAVSATTGASTGSGMQCLATTSVGSGPQGPSMAHETKCYKPGASTCPPAASAAPFLTPDPCYAITSVDDACKGTVAGVCCYDVTEQLMCLG